MKATREEMVHREEMVLHSVHVRECASVCVRACVYV